MVWSFYRKITNFLVLDLQRVTRSRALWRECGAATATRNFATLEHPDKETPLALPIVRALSEVDTLVPPAGWTEIVLARAAAATRVAEAKDADVPAEAPRKRDSHKPGARRLLVDALPPEASHVVFAHRVHGVRYERRTDERRPNWSLTAIAGRSRQALGAMSVACSEPHIVAV